MNKYAHEKTAQEYYGLGMALALQNIDSGMSKTASPRGKNLAAMLGIGGAGLAGGAALASHLAPKAERAAMQLADMSPMQFMRELKAAGQSRLGMTDNVTRKILQNADLDDMDRYERLAATFQALKPSSLREMPMIGPDGNPVSKLEALNYLNPFADKNVYSMDTLRGLGLVD